MLARFFRGRSALDRDQLSVLCVIRDLFLNESLWVKRDRLRHLLDVARAPLDLDAVAARIPGAYWIYPRDTDGEVRLRVSGLRVVGGADRELDAFTRALAGLVRRYRTGEWPIVLKSADVLEQCGGDQRLAHHVYMLLYSEWMILGGGSYTDETTWRFEVGSNFRDFRDVETLEDYERVVAGYDRQRRKAMAYRPSRWHAWAARLWEWLSDVLSRGLAQAVGAGILLLVGYLLGRCNALH